MHKLLYLFLGMFSLQACKSPVAKEQDTQTLLKGEWKVTDFRNQYYGNISEKTRNELEKAVQLQRRRLQEFASFSYYPDSSYHLVFSSHDFDKGTWQIIRDTILIYQSQLHNVTDTSVIHFSGPDEAVISMSDDQQSAQLTIQRK